MQCQRCGRQPYELCLNCESYLFNNEIELKISGAKVTRLLEEKQKLSDKSKEKGVTIFYLRIGIAISVSIGLALGSWGVQLRWAKDSRPLQGSTIQLLPNNYAVAEEFSVEEQLRDVNIRVSVECNDCADKSLAMLLLNEDNYRKFKLRLEYKPRHEGIGIEAFGFDGNLERDHYYIVFYNTSISRTVSIKTNINLIYK